jgi:hypothetical protein
MKKDKKNKKNIRSSNGTQTEGVKTSNSRGGTRPTRPNNSQTYEKNSQREEQDPSETENLRKGSDMQVKTQQREGGQQASSKDGTGSKSV